MVTVPQRVSSQTEKDRLCVRPMATPVRPYAKEGWDSVSSRVTGPRHLTQWFGRTRGGVLVLDDLMEEGGQDKRVLDLFTKDSHHRNITVLYLTQDLFPLANFPRRSIAMPITSWRSKTPGVKRAYEPFYCKPFPTVGVKSSAYLNASRRPP